MARWLRRSCCAAAAGVAAAVFLSGCTPTPFAEPTIIARSPNTISIQAGSWGNPRATAEAHCNTYGKSAVYVGQRRVNETKVTDLYIYDCRDRIEK